MITGKCKMLVCGASRENIRKFIADVREIASTNKVGVLIDTRTLMDVRLLEDIKKTGVIAMRQEDISHKDNKPFHYTVSKQRKRK